MAIKSLKALVESANRLKALREKKDNFYEAYRKTMEPMETEIDELNLELLAGFRTIGINNVKLDTGESYTRALKRGLEVTNDMLAMKWAMANMAISIDKRIVAQKLKEVTEAPAGFKFFEREEVRVTKPKEKVEAENKSKE